MTNKKTTRRALLSSLLSLLLCCSMLLGTTFAWFTDSVTSSGNIIKSGTLDVEMWYGDEADKLVNVQDPALASNAIFDYKLWEPGFTQIKYIQIKNVGDLAFQYQLRMIPEDLAAKGTKLAEVIDVYCAIVKEGFVAPTRNTYNSMTKLGTLEQMMASATGVDDGILLPANGAADFVVPSGEVYTGDVTVCIALHMQETAGNEYQNLSIGDGFDVQLIAAQMTYEKDSFDDLYDQTAQWPVTASGSGSFANNKSGTNTFKFNIKDLNDHSGNDNIKVATAEVNLASVADENTVVTINIKRVETNSNVTVAADQTAKTYEVTASGLKEGNSEDVKVEMGIEKGLTGVKLYHYDAEMPADKYTYDPNSGIITFYTDTFSPFTLVFDSEPAETEIPEGSDKPVAVVERSYQYENKTLPWGSYGQWSPTEGLDSNLEAAYTFTCKDTVAEAKASPYANWYCDFYVKLDKDLGANEIFLGGNYGSFGWVGFHNGDLTLDANTEIALLGSVTSNPWTYADVATNVGTFICGVGDVDDKLAGATFTVMLRLTNPENEAEVYNVATINYTFGKTVNNATDLKNAVAEENATVSLGGGDYTFPAKVAEGVTLVCAENTVFTGKSNLNAEGATVIGATFRDEDTAVSGTLNGTFKNCTFEGSEALRWCYSETGKTVVFENCTFKTDFRGVHFDDLSGTVIFKNCEINGFNAYGGEGKAIFEGCTFGNDESKYNGLNIYSNTDLINCKFNYVSGKTNFIDMEGTGKTLTIDGCTATLDGAEIDIADMVGGSKLAQNTVIYK